MIFNKRKKITINVKLLAGLDQIEGYNPEKGIDLQLPDKSRVKQLLKEIDFSEKPSVSFIVNGEKAGPRDRLSDGDEVFCFLPFAGG